MEESKKLQNQAKSDDENEEIESRYSDEIKEDNYQLINGGDNNMDAGETGTTNDLNSRSNNNNQELPGQETTRTTQPPVESTADLIMRRAEEIGDFDQFK